MRAPDADMDPGSNGLYNKGIDRAIAVIRQHEAETHKPGTLIDKVKAWLIGLGYAGDDAGLQKHAEELCVLVRQHEVERPSARSGIPVELNPSIPSDEIRVHTDGKEVGRIVNIGQPQDALELDEYGLAAIAKVAFNKDREARPNSRWIAAVRAILPHVRQSAAMGDAAIGNDADSARAPERSSPTNPDTLIELAHKKFERAYSDVFTKEGAELWDAEEAGVAAVIRFVQRQQREILGNAEYMLLNSAYKAIAILMVSAIKEAPLEDLEYSQKVLDDIAKGAVSPKREAQPVGEIPVDYEDKYVRLLTHIHQEVSALEDFDAESLMKEIEECIGDQRYFNDNLALHEEIERLRKREAQPVGEAKYFGVESFTDEQKLAYKVGYQHAKTDARQERESEKLQQTYELARQQAYADNNEPQQSYWEGALRALNDMQGSTS
jgi:hypothetical protein